MWKFLSRVFFFLIVWFIFVNSAAFFILNSPIVQNTIVSYINTNYFAPQKLHLRLGSLNINPFTGALNLNEIAISETDPTQSKPFAFEMSQLSVVFNVTSSYLKRKPVVGKLLLRGMKLAIAYRPNGKLALPAFLNVQEEDSQKELNLPDTLAKITPLFPKEIVVLNGNIILGTRGDGNYQNINISYLDVLKGTNKNKIPKFDVKLLINNTTLYFPLLSSNIDLRDVQATASILQNGDIDLPSLTVDSNVIGLNTKAHFRIVPKLRDSKYFAEVKFFDLRGEDFFKLIHFKSSGHLTANGQLTSGENLYAVPTFLGKAQWKDLTLEGFDIYSGAANVVLKNKTLFYRDAKIATHRNGLIYANGEFRLFGTFHFEGKARVENLPFEELLAGLRAPGSPVDFRVNAKEISVSGNIKSPNAQKVFDLSARGDGKISDLLVTPFDQRGRNPLPNLTFNLNLNANVQNITFDKTYATVEQVGNPGIVSVKKGDIDLTPQKGVGVLVTFTGKNIDAASAQYFLKFPSSGLATIDGEVTTKPGTSEVFFKAKASVEHGSLFGVHFNHLDSEWGLDPKGVWAKQTKVMLGSSTEHNQSAVVNIPQLRADYKDLNSLIDMDVTGNVSALSSSLSEWLPQTLRSVSGEINTLNIHMQGLLMHPSRWDLAVTSSTKNLKFLNGTIEKSEIHLNCISGVCKNSSIYLSNISENQTRIRKHVQEQKGYFFLEIQNVSFLNSNFKLKAYRVPLSILSPLSESKISGDLSANAQMFGTWGHLGGFSDISIYQLHMQELNLGNVQFAVRPQNGNLHFDMESFNRQLNASLDLPQDLSGNSKINVNLTNFDPTVLLKASTRADYNLFSQFTGKFVFSGPSPFSNKVTNKEDVFKKWSGSGKFDKGNVEIGNLFFNLTEIGDITFTNQKLAAKRLSLTGDLGNIQTGGEVDFLNQTMNVATGVNLNLAHLHKGFQDIESAEGTAIGDIYARGTFLDPKFSGSIAIHSKSFLVKKIPPAFTDVSGQILFRGSRIEIENLTAKKGSGTTNLAGWIDFADFLKSKTQSPSLYLASTMKNADIKLQVPVLQRVDLQLNSEISISGEGEPYEISGQATIKKLRVFRQATCNQMSAELLSRPRTINLLEEPFANLNVSIYASNSIQIQTKCVSGRFSTAPVLVVVGDTVTPLLNGGISADSANLYVLKSRFDVKKANIQFVDVQKYDPNVDIQMEAKYYPAYIVYWNIYGRFSEARLDLSVDPPTLQNGDRIIQADLISAISTGQMPLESSSGNLISASTGVASFLGVNNIFETTLNDTVTTVTGGLIDSVSVVPTTQSGQLSWRATARKALSQRFDLGVSYESGTLGTNQSAYANYLFNDTVSAVGSFNSMTYFQQQETQEFFGGLRFYFGNQ